MSKPFYDNKDKIAAIKYCKEHIEENGYCSMRYALQQAVPGKTFESFPHQRAFFKSTSSLITRDGKYRVRYRYSDDATDIEINPDYKKKGFFEKHPIIEKLAIALFSAFLTFCVNLMLSKSQQQSQHQVDKQQDQLIRDLRDSVDILQRHISDSAK